VSVIISLTDVWFRYTPARWVVQGAALAFEPGITAIVGPNGSGKSTILRLALGVVRAERGSVAICGTPIERVSASQRAARIAYIAQRADMSAGFTVREVVALGRFALRRDERAIDRALERTGIESVRDSVWRELSVGQQQLVSVARALAQLGDATGEPRALLADEPTAAMDPVHVARTAAILRAVADSGTAVVVASHDLALARSMADRGVLLGPGGVVMSHGPAPETLTPAMLERLFGVPFTVAHGDGGTTIAPTSQITRGV